ncbi:MAG: tetratricopeptide repeat protein [Magnetococcales bacterium]|nr:tetratricopeptide repeat protein [Magnetococcales bacterium]
MDMDLSLSKQTPELLVVLDQADLERLLALIQNIIGIPFPKDRLGDLARHLRDMALSLRFRDQRDFVKWFLNDADHTERIELLAKQLTIGETYFFRDEKNFHLLGREILPKLHHAGKEQIILWSAGCSSGEEPYTMAMTAHMAHLSNQEVHIVASDVNPVALDKARLGIYSGWSFRNPPPGILEKYFTRIGHDKFQIAAQIQEKVLFMKVNLMADCYPPPLDKPASVDVIFCRNVLMYFTKEKRDEVINKFFLLLADNGWFFVSPSESALIQHPGLTLDRSSEPNVFRKGLVKQQPQPMTRGAAHHALVPLVSSRPAQEARKLVPKPQTGRTRVVQASLQESSVLEKADRLFHGKYLAEAAALLTAYLDTPKKPGQDHPAQYQEAVVLLAKIQANLGNLDQAEACYRRAIAADRLQADYYYNLAVILLEKGDPDGAVALLEKTLFLQPDLVVAHLQLASLSRDKKKAKKFAHNVLDLLANDSPDAIVPFSDGLTAATISHMARQMTGS